MNNPLISPLLNAGTADALHPGVDITSKMSAEEYMERSKKLHASALPQPGWIAQKTIPALQWVGDAMLNVPPINRLCCAVGLTAGLATGGAAARLLAGQYFSGKPIKLEEYHPKIQKLIKPLHGLKWLHHEGHDTSMKAGWKNLAMWSIFTAGGFAGVVTGTTMAYRNSYKRNRHPDDIATYAGRASNEQGDGWKGLVGLSAIFGSSSGFSMIPVPGLNYGISIASRVVLMQDRGNMMGGKLGKWFSGSPTATYLHTREGLEDICKYAVGNTSTTPVELEYKSFNVLAQLFPKDVKAEHIQRFVNEIHEVRDKYFELYKGDNRFGSVPKEKRKAMMEEMQAKFTGKGLEDTLIDIGLNPRAIDLTHMNGFIGSVGSHLGAHHNLVKLQKEFDAKMVARHPDLPPAKVALLEPKLEPAQEAPIEITSSPKFQKNLQKSSEMMADRVKKRDNLAAVPLPASHSDRAEQNKDSGTALGLSA